MSAHVVDQLCDLALGTLPATERASVTGHLAECAACSAELRAVEETLGMLALDLPPAEPPPEILERLVASTKGRYEGLLDKVARMWDLGRDKVRALFDGMASAVWEPSGIPGVDLQHIQPGPLAAHADAGFVRFAPHMQFPLHSHSGDELQLILDGGMTDHEGVGFLVGDTMFKPQGSSHSFVAGPEGCVIALLLVGGIVIDGVRYGVKS